VAVVCEVPNGVGISVRRLQIARASKLDKMSPKPNGPYLYTVAEAAEYIRVSERTMRKIIAEIAIPYRRTGSRKRGRIVFLQSDLNKWLGL
jgi:excisionase family DNA binding protein